MTEQYGYGYKRRPAPSFTPPHTAFGEGLILGFVLGVLVTGLVWWMITP
jgi:hypothetical protein